MPEEYIFRSLKSSWGIWVRIVAEVHPRATFTGTCYEVEKGLSLVFGKASGDTHDVLIYYPIGLRLIYPDMQPLLEQIGPLVVHVLEEEDNTVDYQPEGLAYAIAGWMIRHFQLRTILPPIHYDRERRRYIFDLPPQEAHHQLLYDTQSGYADGDRGNCSSTH